jgi:L-rhamnose mutarotase
MEFQYWQLAGAAIALLFGAAVGFCCARVLRGAGMGKQGEPSAKPAKAQRFGSVIGLKADKKDRYNDLHAHAWPEINAMIRECNIHNYSIYETVLEGKLYLFSYFEYIGDDFKADMARMAADPKTQDWWKETDPCQIRLPDTPDGEQWKGMSEVYHLD